MVFPLRFHYVQTENVHIVAVDGNLSSAPLLFLYKEISIICQPCTSTPAALSVFLQIRGRQGRIQTGMLDTKLAALAYALELK